MQQHRLDASVDSSCLLLDHGQLYSDVQFEMPSQIQHLSHVTEKRGRKEREEGWEGEKMNLLLKKTRNLGIFHNVFVHIVNSSPLIITLRR